MAHKNLAWFEFKLKAEHKNFNTQPSQTVPDETLTVRQIMEKHVRHQRIADDLIRTPVYNDHDDFDAPDLEKVRDMDLFEREEFSNSNKEKIAEMQEKQKKSFLEKKKKEDAKRQGDQRSTTEEENEAKPRSKKPRYEAPSEGGFDESDVSEKFAGQRPIGRGPSGAPKLPSE